MSIGPSHTARKSLCDGIDQTERRSQKQENFFLTPGSEIRSIAMLKKKLKPEQDWGEKNGVPFLRTELFQSWSEPALMAVT